MNLAIIGATGNVGRKILEVLEKSEVAVDNLILVASKKSEGKKIFFKKKEFIIEPIPHAIVNGLMYVLCPADFKMANPWPFWINKTVIANGTTSSILALKLNSGKKIVGTIGLKFKSLNISGWLELRMITTPTTKEPSRGGIILCNEGIA